MSATLAHAEDMRRRTEPQRGGHKEEATQPHTKRHPVRGTHAVLCVGPRRSLCRAPAHATLERKPWAHSMYTHFIPCTTKAHTLNLRTTRHQLRLTYVRSFSASQCGVRPYVQAPCQSTRVSDLARRKPGRLCPWPRGFPCEGLRIKKETTVISLDV